MVLIIAILNDETNRDELYEKFTCYHLLVEIVIVMNTNFLLLQDKFGVRSLRHSPAELMASLYLQVATTLVVYANWSFVRIKGMEWDWTSVI
ncbi:hypothetical protein HN51_055057 [Arachis hypogaea]